MQPNSRKYIIGGGISGLVWNYYHPEYIIITPESKGETFTRTYMVWLHDEPETRKLLTDLGLPVIPKSSLIGYYQKHWICDQVSPEMNVQLIQKKMSLWNQPLDTSFQPKTTDMSLATVGGNSYLKTLDVDLNEVIRRLNEKATIICGKVMTISDTIITVSNSPDLPDLHLEYERLVSTIAAPFFWLGYGEKKEFKCMPITNIITSVKPKEFDDKYEMVYYDDSVPFTRVSHLGDKYALEFTGEITQEEFEKLYPELKVDDYFLVKQGRIFENEENVPPNDKITFSGRFAQWKYGITTEDVVKQAIDYK